MKKNPYFDNHKSLCDASRLKPYSVEQFQATLGTRSICIWGAGQKGRGFLKALRRHNFSVDYFLDSDPRYKDTSYESVPIVHPDEILKAGNAKDFFIITATVDIKNKEISTLLSGFGLIKGIDYDQVQSFSPFYPTIEVTGTCNLKCSSCPRGDTSLLTPGSFMSLELYKQVVDKLVQEIPFLYLVDLYMWGEPLLNPDINKIIEYNNSLGLASGLSTNLNNISNLDKALAAKPALLRISNSGVSSETYDVTHTGGKWSSVKKNLAELHKLLKKYGDNTIIEYYFHIYKHNMHEVGQARQICEEYGFRFHPALAILFHDYALAYSRDGQVPPPAQTANHLLVRDISSLLEDCRNESSKSCILTRCFPNIDWDGSVKACCTYAKSCISDSYLDMQLPDLIDMRTYSDACATCQEHSLHRWNNQSRYMDYVKTLVPS